MRYLYKINSGYDGFSPRRIPERLIDGRFLRLGWARYLDALRLGDEVWIVFVGKGFENGVYVEGLVASIDPDAGAVRLRVRRRSTAAPLTDAAMSAELIDAVSVRYRQVFFWPASRQLQDQCHLSDCEARSCRACDIWNAIPQLEPAHYQPPPSLRGTPVVPAYWIIPPRCFLYYHGRRPAPWIRRVTDMFSAFKVGEARYAFPLAAGIAAGMGSRGEAGFDGIVPIPLSPEKAAAGELDRTGALADELADLVGSSASRILSLAEPISKRRMLAQGYTEAQFRTRYQQLLQINPSVGNLSRIVLLDDVITRGLTLSVAAAAIRAANPQIDIVVAAAGQMIVTAVVADQNGPAW